MSKFKAGDKVRVIAMDFDGDTSLIGMTGVVVSVQASNEDKPGGPDGPWMITVSLNDTTRRGKLVCAFIGRDTTALYDDSDAWFNEDELELMK